MTPDQFQQMFPQLTHTQRLVYLPALTAAQAEFQINTPVRLAAFLGQVCEESGCLRYWEEIWDPTPAQKGYEGRKDLGNTHPGDGYRYRGRGAIAITGRANYAKYGQKLKLPLEEHPEMAAHPDVGFRIAGAYWFDRGLNQLADQNTEAAFREITRRINGGYTHLAQREGYWEQAKQVLGIK